MDWDQLRVFLAVARAGQILGAAQRLGLNHATVSRHIAALEERLAARLIERHSTGCTLTTAGERLKLTAERMEAELLRAQSDLVGTNHELAGAVRVGAPDGFGNYFLAPELPALSSRHPELAIELVPLPRTFSLSRREADIAISLDRPTHGRLIARKLTEYGLSVYASTDHLDRFGPILSAEDLAGRVIVTGIEEMSYSSALKYHEALERFSGKRFACASIAGQLEAVLSGNGVGIIHDYIAVRYSSLVPVLPAIRFRRTYWIISHPDSHHIRRVSAVYRAIVERTQAAKAAFDRAPLTDQPGMPLDAPEPAADGFPDASAAP